MTQTPGSWPPPGRQPQGWAPPAGAGVPGPWAPRPPAGQQQNFGRGPQSPYASAPYYAGPYPPPPAGSTPAGGTFSHTQPTHRPNPYGKVLVLGIGLVVLLGVVLAALNWGNAAPVGPDGGGPVGGYANEGYQLPPPDKEPPPFPRNKDATQATAALQKNPFYAQSVPQPVRCDVTQIDTAKATAAALETHMNNLVGCLMRVWVEPIQKAGFQLPRPSVTVYSSAVTTGCGKLPMQNAVYCSADQQIYYAIDLPKVIAPELRAQRFIVESVMAHEFGHHLQARTGILNASQGFRQSSSQPVALEYGRRTEVQADCFMGEFVRSISYSGQITQTELDNLSVLAFDIGDDSLSGKPEVSGGHGKGTTRSYWTEMGLASPAVSACNTFVAPPDIVR